MRAPLFQAGKGRTGRGTVISAFLIWTGMFDESLRARRKSVDVLAEF